MTSDRDQKKLKGQSLIRWEAIVPFFITSVIIGAYFHFFFDTHLRKGLEWVGYKVVGAEVNVEKLETSFFKASLRIQNIEITDAELPSHNAIKIGDIRFSMLWDALLRAKVVINEAAVEQIAFHAKRKSPGKVKPPEPPSTEPGVAEKLKEQALIEAQDQAGENILGDILAMLGGSDSQSQLEKLKATLPSKDMLAKFENDLKSKKEKWDQRLGSLPQGKDIKSLSARLEKIKTKDFKSPQELQTSLQEIDRVFKDGEAIYKQVQSAGDDLGKDLNVLESQYKDIEKQVKADIKTLEQHFRIPKLDAKALSMALFNRYLQPYRAKFLRYKAMADQYLPPNLLNKDAKKDEVLLTPHPREKGIVYEFGRPYSYPLFWIKRTSVSSQAGVSADAGNIKGEILDITSNQKIIRKPTILNISGDFPAQQISGFLVGVTLDNTKEESQVEYLAQVSSYAISGRELVQTPDVQIAFENASGSLDLRGKMIDLKNISLNMKSTFRNISYNVASKNEIAEQILKAVFAGIPVVTLNVEAQGVLPSLSTAINSNLGPELQKGFEKQIQAKINEAQQRIKAMIDQELGKQKALVEAQMNQLRSRFNEEIKKTQTQLDEQKKLAEDRMNQAKKDTENQGRKQLEKEGQKAIDDLKKKFGL